MKYNFTVAKHIFKISAQQHTVLVIQNSTQEMLVMQRLHHITLYNNIVKISIGGSDFNVLMLPFTSSEKCPIAVNSCINRQLFQCKSCINSLKKLSNESRPH